MDWLGTAVPVGEVSAVLSEGIMRRCVTLNCPDHRLMPCQRPGCRCFTCAEHATIETVMRLCSACAARPRAPMGESISRALRKLSARRPDAFRR
jgi:hypothetical protein